MFSFQSESDSEGEFGKESDEEDEDKPEGEASSKSGAAIPGVPTKPNTPQDGKRKIQGDPSQSQASKKRKIEEQKKPQSPTVSGANLIGEAEIRAFLQTPVTLAEVNTKFKPKFQQDPRNKEILVAFLKKVSFLSFFVSLSWPDSPSPLRLSRIRLWLARMSTSKIRRVSESALAFVCVCVCVCACVCVCVVFHPLLLCLTPSCCEMEERVRIPFLSEDDEGKWLEAVCAFQESPVALVFTHPYAPLGGDMDNNVVVKLSRYFSGKGFNTIRFNFRGVGLSDGSGTWTATGEADDVRAVCRFILSSRPHVTKIILVVRPSPSL